MAATKNDTPEGLPASPAFRAVMLLDNSFHAPDGLTVNGKAREATDGFVVATRGEVVDVPADASELAAAVRLVLDLGRAAPAQG